MQAQRGAGGSGASENLSLVSLDNNPRCIILKPSRLVTEGCLRKHLQTRGGERWPGNDCASEMRCAGPAVQAASAPVPPRRGPPSGGLAPLPKGEAPENGSPPGALRSKPINTARGTPWDWRTCGTTGFDKPRCREASRPAGPFGPIGVPRALGAISGSERRKGNAAYPGPSKEYGRRSVDFSPPRPEERRAATRLEARPQAPTGVEPKAAPRPPPSSASPLRGPPGSPCTASAGCPRRGRPPANRRKIRA